MSLEIDKFRGSQYNSIISQDMKKLYTPWNESDHITGNQKWLYLSQTT